MLRNMHAGSDVKTAGTAVLLLTCDGQRVEDRALPTLPTMAWKIAHHDLPNRVTISLTLP